MPKQSTVGTQDLNESKRERSNLLKTTVAAKDDGSRRLDVTEGGR